MNIKSSAIPKMCLPSKSHICCDLLICITGVTNICSVMMCLECCRRYCFAGGNKTISYIHFSHLPDLLCYGAGRATNPRIKNTGMDLISASFKTCFGEQERLLKSSWEFWSWSHNMIVLKGDLVLISLFLKWIRFSWNPLWEKSAAFLRCFTISQIRKKD